ncbi:MAG: dockerin type I repeat-containing protein [Phycisphaerales bacterium]|jgi:hypothetical protein|nr:dockerin type I repeat-containing protein [Phycisphaerales bacterium]
MLKPIIVLITTSAVAITVLNNSFADKRDNNRGGEPERGPDVVSWYAGGSGGGYGLDMVAYGSQNGINSFAFGTTSCNFGDMVADWYDNTNRVPVIAQTCYRLKNGRFEQIGTAWLKHSFCAVSEPGCGNCQATSCDTLGIGCADTYWAGLNADAVAPRSAINAFTGYYDYPFSISPTGDGSMKGKLQLKIEDIDPELNPDALYFIEAQYVSPDDAEWGNQDNNASYRWIKFGSPTEPIGLSSTQVTVPVIYGWKWFDEDLDVKKVRVPEEGLLYVAVRVYDNEDGTWQYEYAIQNLNSDRSVNSFTIPLGDCVSISDVGFHDIDYHSGEIIDGTDWDITIAQDSVTWNTVDFETNEWGNAIRWGSMYSFWFTADQPPSNADLVLGLFKPGPEPTVTHSAAAPDCPADCIGDVDGSGSVNVADLLATVNVWGTSDPSGDVNNDGIVNVSDLLAIMADWGCS